MFREIILNAGIALLLQVLLVASIATLMSRIPVLVKKSRIGAVITFTVSAILFIAVVTTEAGQKPKADIILLGDKSGSMANYANDLKNVLWNSNKRFKWRMRTYLFSSSIEEVKTAKDIKNLQIGGNTNLTYALETVNKENPQARILLIATDGLPDNSESSEKAAAALRARNVKICVCYLSSDPAIPPLLSKMSDVFITSTSLQNGLDSCILELKKRGVDIKDERRDVDLDELANSFK